MLPDAVSMAECAGRRTQRLLMHDCPDQQRQQLTFTIPGSAATFASCLTAGRKPPCCKAGQRIPSGRRDVGLHKMQAEQQ